MKVVFSTNGQLRDALGEEEIALEFAEQARLLDVAQEVAARVNAGARRLLLDENDHLQQGLMIVINDEMVFEGEEDIKDGDHVSILLPMAGG
jgi:molybdopterin converting factor small subunit